MLRISQLKLPVTHTEEDLKKKIVHTLMCRTEAVQSYEIIKQSLDARKKPDLFYVYTALQERNNVTHSYNRKIAMGIITQAKQKFYKMFCELKEEIDRNWI